MMYLPIIRISLMHEYYSDGICKYLRIIPEAKTIRILNNHRCLLRENSSGLTIAQCYDNSAKPFIRILDKVSLRFKLLTTDQEFFSVTETSEFNTKNRKIPVFNNNDISNGALHLTYKVSSDKKGRDGEENSLENDQMSESNYEPLKSGEISYIELTLNENASESKMPDYIIEFRTKSVYWEYFLVARKNPENPEFLIKDAISNAEGRIRFKEIPPDIASRGRVRKFLNDQYPNKKIIHFASEKPVKLAQLSRKNLQLTIDGEKVIHHLPNPPIYNINLYENREDRDNEIQDSIYQIVKYYNPNSSTMEI